MGFNKFCMLSNNKNLKKHVFVFARSCLGKVPGRAPFSQLSKRATACTIRMQIVKQINKENESDQANNKLGQQIPNSKLNAERCSETRGTHKMKVEREDWSQQYRHRRGAIGCIPVTVAQGESTIGLVEVSLSVYS